MLIQRPWPRGLIDLKGKRLSENEKHYLGQLVNSGDFTCRDVAKRFNLGPSTIHKYAVACRKGSKIILHDGYGRVPYLDPISEKSVIDELCGEKRIQLNNDEFKEKFYSEGIKTAKRRNRGRFTVKAPSRRTLKRFESRNKVKTKSAEETPDAREYSCSNYRNCVSAVIAFMVAARRVRKGATVNFDASSDKVGDRNDQGSEAKFIGKVQQGKSFKVKKREGKKGITAYFIKTMVIMNDDGLFGPKVHMFANANMKEDEMDVHEVKGIGITKALDSDSSYVVFCKSRNMHEAFYSWYWNTVVFPFCRRIRTSYKLKETDLINVNCDGEDVQISVFSDIEFQHEYDKHNVFTDKPSGSSTEITQACDTGPVFLTKNNFLKGLSDMDVQDDTIRIEIIAEVFKNHQINFPKFTASHQRMAIFGLLRVVYAYARACQPDHAIKSFLLTGQTDGDLAQVVRNCTTPWSLIDEAHLFDNAEALCKLYEKQGQLYKVDYDRFNIPNNDDEKKKEKEDCASIGQHRTVRLDHPEIRKLLATLKDAKEKKNVEKVTRATEKRSRDEKLIEAGGQPKAKKAYKPRKPKAKASKLHK